MPNPVVSSLDIVLDMPDDLGFTGTLHSICSSPNKSERNNTVKFNLKSGRIQNIFSTRCRV